MVFVSEATPSVGTGGAGRTTPRRSQRLRSQAVVSEAAPLVAPTADADGVVVDHRHHGGEKRRLARLVGYYVAVAAGCVMGMVSAHNNARRTTLGCTAHCEASIRTLRNFLGIVSSPVSGAFSDVYGRRVALMASSVVMIVSYVVWCYATTVEVFVLYNALNGIAGLSMTFTVCKALVADGSVPEDKVETQGILGAAAGCGIILGPAIAMLFLTTYSDAAIAAILVQLSVLAVLAMVPFETAPGQTTAPASAPPTANPSMATDPAAADDAGAPVAANAGMLWGITAAARRAWTTLRTATPSTLILVGCRFTLSLGYHIFLTGYYDMLRDRGLLTTPRAWSQYMAYLGVLYAATQRLAAGPLSRWPQRSALLGSVVCIGCGRLCAVTLSYTEPALYASFGLAVAGVAVFNTLINGMATRISERNGTGGLLGLIQSAEDVSGLIGPTLGSIAFTLSPVGPLSACLALYVVLLLWVGTRWSVVEAAALAAGTSQDNAKSKVV